jgi:hypothetical protein
MAIINSNLNRYGGRVFYVSEMSAGERKCSTPTYIFPDLAANPISAPTVVEWWNTDRGWDKTNMQTMAIPTAFWMIDPPSGPISSLGYMMELDTFGDGANNIHCVFTSHYYAGSTTAWMSNLDTPFKVPRTGPVFVPEAWIWTLHTTTATLAELLQFAHTDSSDKMIEFTYALNAQVKSDNPSLVLPMASWSLSILLNTPTHYHLVAGDQVLLAPVPD